MRRFLRLLHKEWRDHRALILVWACLAPVLSQVAQWVFLDPSSYRAEVAGRWILPSLELLFLAALAPELVARESQAGVADSLGRLPVTTGLLWFAKLAFLVSVGILSTTWLFATECAWRALLDRPVVPVLEAFRGASLAHVALVAGTALVFACGILVRNGFGGAILGVGVIFGLPYLISQALHLERGVRFMAALSLWSLPWWTAVVAVAALLASRLAYRPWRGGPGDVPRRFGLFGAGLLLILTPAGLAAARRYRLASEFSFHDPRVEIWHAAPSPDGRFVALTLGMDYPGAFGSTDGSVLRDMWVLEVDTGVLAKLPDSHQRALPIGYGWGSPWTDEGELRVHTWGESDYRTWNLSDGSLTPQDLDALVGSWRWWHYKRKAREHVITWPERDIEVSFPRPGSFPHPSPEPGVIFSVDEEGRLLRHSLLDGARDALLEDCRADGGPFISTDGTRLAMNHGESVRYLDADTGAALAVAPAGWRHSAWTDRLDPWAICVRSDRGRRKVKDRMRFLLISSDAQREIVVDGKKVWVLDRNRILVLEDDKRLLLVDGEGRTLRTLYEPREDD